MGTRGLTMVVADGEYKIAQYGQWDHYPDGQGLKVLKFCNKLLDDNNMSIFRKQLNRTRWVTQSQIDRAHIEIGVDNNVWMTMEQTAKFDLLFPFMSRDHGAEILDMVFSADIEKDIFLNDSHEFGGDSLLCEWAYLINLDTNELEVFKGFNTDFTKASARFTDCISSHEKYAPVQSIKIWKLNALPTAEEFLSNLIVEEK